MYEVISEELDIKACGLADLTTEQVNHFLGYWKEGTKIGSLTVFFERDTGTLVLNKDHVMYDMWRELAEGYMGASSEARKEMLGQCPETRIKEALQVMENCLEYRKIKKELFRATKNRIDNMEDHAVFKDIWNKYNLVDAVTIAYRYGVMNGKRIERVKKKRQYVNA